MFFSWNNPPPFLYLRQSNRLDFLFLRPEIPRKISSNSNADREVGIVIERMRILPLFPGQRLKVFFTWSQKQIWHGWIPLKATPDSTTANFLSAHFLTAQRIPDGFALWTTYRQCQRSSKAEIGKNIAIPLAIDIWSINGLCLIAFIAVRIVIWWHHG